MATPSRRSSRLRSSGTPAKTTTPKPARGLGSLTEADETPERKNDISMLIATTPGKSIPGAFEVTTPEQQPTHPSHRDMHPEHVHMSTVKVSNAGLKLGFADVNPYQSSPLRPSYSRVDMSPAASNVARSSPGYQFSFNRDNTDLSEEAQRIMASVRDEAQRIKEKMRHERQEQRRRDEEAEEEAGLGGRRFAKPKSRYSDVHKAEFSKMQSIADQASLWKNRVPPAPQTVDVEPQPATPTNLKRTRSKVDLQGSRLPAPKIATPVETQPVTPVTLKRTPSKFDLSASKSKIGLLSLKRTQSKVDLQSSSKDAKTSDPRQDLSRAEDSSPVKRRKMNTSQDVSAVRPASSGAYSSKIPTKSGLPAAASTPTKSSLNRSRDVRDAAASKLPTSTNFSTGLVRSKSVKDLVKPSGLRTASGRLASAVSRKVNSMRSILHKPTPKYSDDPMKIAAGTHLPPPRATPSTHEGTPSLPGTPRPQHTLPRATPKRVEFAPDTKDASNKIVSPSPVKFLPVEYPDLTRSIERSVSLSPSKSIASEMDDVPTPKASYPTPAKQGSILRGSLQPRANPLFSNPPSAGDFTFRHEKRINFSSQQLPSLASPKCDSSTLSRSASIRHVRPAGASTSVSVSPSRLNNDPPPPHRLLGVAHGINSKKRAREGDVDSSDLENVDPKRRAVEEVEDRDDEQNSPRKRARMATPEKKMPVKSAARLRRQTGVGAKPQKRGGLSLARLNFLSTPKNRH